MVIIHKERVSIQVIEMDPGTVFFNKSGRLCMVTDEYDDVDGMRIVVDLQSGATFPYYGTEIAIPQKITTVEVE